MEVALALGPYDSGELGEQKPSNDVLFSIIKIGIGEGEAFFCYRHYSPETGTFISPDPIGFEGGDTNLYGYVFNNSVNLTDPTGEGPIAVLACHLGLGISTVISLYLLSEDTEALDKKISAANEIIYDQNACTERRRKAISQILIND